MQGKTEGEDRALKSDCYYVVFLEVKLQPCLYHHQNYTSGAQDSEKQYLQARGHDQHYFLLFKQEKVLL